MNKRKLSFEYFVLSLLMGILIILQIESPIEYSSYTSSVSREIASQINKEKIELNDLEAKLDTLNRQYKKFRDKFENENMGLTEEEKAVYYNYRTTVGLEKLSGEGIIIKMESVDTKNIAFDTETNHILLKLVNDIKMVGGEAISINNQQLTANSEIVLAGNHINVNNVPISQPYEIRAIGNEKTLYRYFDEEDFSLKTMENNYGIKTELEKSRRITIPALSVQKDLEFLKKAE